jgi:hypothetical protein
VIAIAKRFCDASVIRSRSDCDYIAQYLRIDCDAIAHLFSDRIVIQLRSAFAMWLRDCAALSQRSRNDCDYPALLQRLCNDFTTISKGMRVDYATLAQ